MRRAVKPAMNSQVRALVAKRVAVMFMCSESPFD
jgi:hypothetical protein